MFIAAFALGLLFVGAIALKNSIPRMLRPYAPALIGAILSAVLAIVVATDVGRLPGWHEGARLVWTGVKQTTGGLIRLGGHDEDTNLRWPTGASAPELTVGCGRSDCELQVTGGG